MSTYSMYYGYIAHEQEKYKDMLKIFQLCKQNNVEIPLEVIDFFDIEGKNDEFRISEYGKKILIDDNLYKEIHGSSWCGWYLDLKKTIEKYPDISHLCLERHY